MFIEARQPSIFECYKDDECGPEQACNKRACINPCLNSCGPGALCRVINHKHQCSCPNGHTGDANVKCTPRKLHVLFEYNKYFIQ